MNRDILKDAVITFGIKKQKVQAVEELSELIQALCRNINKRDNNVEEEIADVEIMLEQLRIIFNEDIINAFKEHKLQRLERRIKEAKEFII